MKSPYLLALRKTFATEEEEESARAAVGGPVGALVGGVAGAILGGGAGHAAGEAVYPTVEKEYWENAYKTRPYYKSGKSFDYYEPAYRYGWENATKPEFATKSFDETSTEKEGGRKCLSVLQSFLRLPGSSDLRCFTPLVLPFTFC
jgi:hypothetical protein